jgi:hypothetical protein
MATGNVVVKWLAFLLRIREVSSWHVVLESGYHALSFLSFSAFQTRSLSSASLQICKLLQHVALPKLCNWKIVFRNGDLFSAGIYEFTEPRSLILSFSEYVWQPISMRYLDVRDGALRFWPVSDVWQVSMHRESAHRKLSTHTVQ